MDSTSYNGLPMPQRLWAILAVSLGVSLSVIDATIANVALPTIASALDISSSDSIWVVNSYQIAVMVTLLSFSALGDLWGYRKVYLVGLATFTAASVLCTFAASFPLLIAGRILQGIGAAGITAVNTTLIRNIYPSRSLGKGMGINATVVAVASVAGPSAASAVLSLASWQMLFAINLPIGVAAFFMSYRYLPANPVHDGKHRFDIREGLANGIVFGLAIGVVEGYSHGLKPAFVAAWAFAAACVTALFIRWQKRRELPIFPIDLLRIPIFSVSVLTSICSFIAQMAAMVVLPFHLQRDLGYDDVQTGLLMTAWPAAIMVAAPVAGWLVTRMHAGLLGGIGLASMTAGLLSLVFISPTPSTFDIVWRLAVCGAGFGLFQSPNNSILIASAPPSRSGSASGMLATARLVGQTTGAALVALMFDIAHDEAAHYVLLTAAAASAAATIVSFARIRLPLPEALRRK